MSDPSSIIRETERTHMKIGDVVTLVKVDIQGRLTKVTGRITGLAESYHNPDAQRVMISEIGLWFDTTEWVQTNG
jgi:hypothetical protein